MSDLSDIEIADLLALPTDTAPKAPTRPQDGEPEPNAYMAGVAWQERWKRPTGAKPCDAEKAEIKANTIEMLCRGINLSKIGQAHNLSCQAIKMWTKVDAEFNTQFNYANECFNEILENSLLDVHNRHFNPAMAAVEAKATMWVLGVRDRERYGTKLEVNNNNNAGLVDVLKAAIARIPRPDEHGSQSLNGPMLDLSKAEDAQVIDIDELLALPSTHS